MTTKNLDKGAKTAYKSPEVRDYGAVRDITMANTKRTHQDHPTRAHYS